MIVSQKISTYAAEFGPKLKFDNEVCLHFLKVLGGC